MTNDQARLDEAVAKAAGWLSNRLFTGNYYPPDKSPVEFSILHPSQDWNALMQAVARLEEKIPHFQFERRKERWCVFRRAQPICAYLFDTVSETEALARCILSMIRRE